MKIDTSFKISNIILIFFIIFLLSISFHNYFGFHLNRYYPDIYPFTCNYKLTFLEYSECQSKSIWYNYIWIENGLVENLQILILMISIIVIIFNFFRLKFNNKKILKYFLIFQFFGLIYMLFEEISWLQHFIGFKTPEVLEKINHQKEFNIHNVSRIFNEIPRTLVLIWCSFSGISLFFLKKKISINIQTILNASNKILFISFILIIFSLPHLIVDKLNLLKWNYLHLNYIGNNFQHTIHMIYSPLIVEGYNYKQMLILIFSSNYFRFSELQELIFYYYFLWHSIYLVYKIKNDLK